MLVPRQIALTVLAKYLQWLKTLPGFEHAYVYCVDSLGTRCRIVIEVRSLRYVDYYPKTLDGVDVTVIAPVTL